MFDNKYFDGSGSGGGSLAPGVTPVVGGTEHAILYIDSALMQGSANFTYDGSNVTLTDGWFRSARTYDDYTYGNQILYGFNSSSTIANLTEGFGAITHYGMNVSMTVSATNMKRQQTLYGSKTTISCYDGMVDETVYAYGWFRTSGTANVLAGETVTVGTVVYTFVATLAAEGDVLIGASQLLSLTNLQYAINGTVGTYGVNHQVTAANADATCTGVYSSTVNLKAVAIGVAGDSVALAETSGRLTRSAATLLRKSATSYSGVYGQDVSIDVQKASLTGAIGYRAIVNVGTSTADQTCNVIRGIETQVAVAAVDASSARGTMHGAYFGAYVNGGLITNQYGLEIDMTLQNDGATSFSAVSGSVYGIKVSATGSCLAGTTTGDAIALYLPDFSFCMAARTYGIMQLGTGTNYFEGTMTFLNLQVGGVVTAAVGTGQLGLVTDAAGVLTSDGSGNLSFAAVSASPGGTDSNIQYNDGGAFGGAATFTFDDTNIIVTLARVVNDAAGPQLIFSQDRGAAGQDADVLGTIAFNGYNDNATPAIKTFGTIVGSIMDASDATEDGKIAMSVLASGSLQTIIQMYHVTATGSYFELVPPEGTGRLKIGGASLNTAGCLWLDSNGGNSEFAFTGSNFGHYDFRIWTNIGQSATTFYDDHGGLTYVLTVKTGAIGLFASDTDTIVGTTGAKVLSMKNTGVAPTAVCADFIQTWCADYAAGDARLYIMGEASTNQVIFGNGQIILTDAECAHGMTTLLPTTGVGRIGFATASNGGLLIEGFNEAARTDPVYNDADPPALILSGTAVGASYEDDCVAVYGYRKDVTSRTGTPANQQPVLSVFGSGNDGFGGNPQMRSFAVLGCGTVWGQKLHQSFGHGMTGLYGLDATAAYTTKTVWSLSTDGNGGVMLHGLTNTTAALSALTLKGTSGAGTPTLATVQVVGTKKNSTTEQALAATDPLFAIYNNTTLLATMYGDGTLSLIRAQFDPINMADDSVQGETFNGVAGENLVWGDVVYLKSDGKFWKADYNATTTTPAVAFCTATINADTTGRLLKKGWVRDDSAYNFTFGAQTGTIYLGASGAITQTAPTGVGDQVQVLGWALEADIFYFEPQLVMVEV